MADERTPWQMAQIYESDLFYLIEHMKYRMRHGHCRLTMSHDHWLKALESVKEHAAKIHALSLLWVEEMIAHDQQNQGKETPHEQSLG